MMPGRFDDVQPFAALKRPAVESLARLLYMKASTTTSKTNSSCDQWLSGQQRQIRQMQDFSIRRQGTLSIVADVFRGDLNRPQETMQALETASLCEAHGELNPMVLSALMKLLTEETTLCTDRFRKHRDKTNIQKRGPDTVVEGEMNPAIEFWLDSISMIPALWMGKTRWEQEMQRQLAISLPVCARYHGCVACKLAVVGGSVQFLMDLRTSLLVRKEYEADMQGVEDEKDVQSPLLLRMVEAWIDMCYAMKKRHFIRQESEMLSPMVVALRGEISAKKLAKRKGLKRGCDSRIYTNSGWPMPLAPLLEVDALAFERLCNGTAEVDDVPDEEEKEEEDGVVAGRRRRNTTVKPREGYSHYLPDGQFSEDTLVDDESPLGKSQNDLKESAASTTMSKSRLPRNSPSRLPGKAGSTVSNDPWEDDYKNHIIAGSIPPTETGLSTIYGLYDNRTTDGKSTAAKSVRSTGIARAASLNVKQTRAPAARCIVPPATKVSNNIARSVAGSIKTCGDSGSDSVRGRVPPRSGSSLSSNGSSRGRRSGAPSPPSSRGSSSSQRPRQSSVLTAAKTVSDIDTVYTDVSVATRTPLAAVAKGKRKWVDTRPQSRLQQPQASKSLLVPPRRLQDRMLKSVLPRPLQSQTAATTGAGESRLPKPPVPPSSVYSVSSAALKRDDGRR